MYLLTIGDTKFFDLIRNSINRVWRLYPDMPVVIYDWGFADNERRLLSRLSNVHDIRKWKLIDSPVYASINNHEWLLCQKPYCYQDFINYYNQPFLFLDGDAWLIREIPELLQDDFSIGVTIRRSGDRDFGINSCRVINSGVFKLNDLTIPELWIERMKRTHEKLVEQTALTRMIFDGTIKQVRFFPCEEYNYYWIDTSIPETAKILHMKGNGVKRRRNYQCILQ